MSFGPADLAASRRMKTTRVGGGHPGYRVIEDPDPDDARRAARQRPAGPLALLDRPHGRRLHGRTASSPSTAPSATSRTSVGCETQFRAAFLLGCVGAWSLHPVQIDIAKKVFSPDPDEVAFAKKVIEAIPDGARRAHDRRQDAGRRDLEAVQGDGRPRRAAGREGPRARRGLRAMAPAATRYEMGDSTLRVGVVESVSRRRRARRRPLARRVFGAARASSDRESAVAGAAVARRRSLGASRRRCCWSPDRRGQSRTVRLPLARWRSPQAARRRPSVSTPARSSREHPDQRALLAVEPERIAGRRRGAAAVSSRRCSTRCAPPRPPTELHGVDDPGGRRGRAAVGRRQPRRAPLGARRRARRRPGAAAPPRLRRGHPPLPRRSARPAPGPDRARGDAPRDAPLPPRRRARTGGHAQHARGRPTAPRACLNAASTARERR